MHALYVTTMILINVQLERKALRIRLIASNNLSMVGPSNDTSSLDLCSNGCEMRAIDVKEKVH